MITELTGLDVANASLLDEASAASEAMFMAYNVHNGKRNKFFLSNSVFPQNIEVIRTKADGLGIELVIDEPANFDFSKASEFCGYLVQNPDNFGNIHDITEVAAKLREQKVVVTVIADILSLTIVKPPGEMGADIAIGSAQRFGVPMGFGGPHAGYMAVKDEFKRKMPGRLIGVSKDIHGNKAYRMSLQTREQHIRRDKATSNICTAQALLANISSFFGQWHRADGLKAQANRVRNFADILISELNTQGFSIKTDTVSHFDTVTIDVKGSGLQSADWVVSEFHKYGMNLRRIDETHVGVSFNETTSLVDLDEMLEIFSEMKSKANSPGFLTE
jgi:glycine dehydrogenase